MQGDGENGRQIRIVGSLTIVFFFFFYVGAQFMAGLLTFIVAFIVAVGTTYILPGKKASHQVVK